MNNAADAAYYQRKDKDNAEQRGYYYGFNKGMTN